MFAVSVRSENALLIRKVLQPGSLLVLVAICACQGCKTAEKLSALTPKSSVLVQTAAANDQQNAWLQSATITYARQTSPVEGEEKIALANYSNPSAENALRVLAIRYPHPKGHQDRARVELVVADTSTVSKKKAWYQRFGKTLNDTLPGIAWGEGIQEARALDLPLEDLQNILATSKSDVNPKTTPTPQVQLTSEINGQSGVINENSLPGLEELAQKVAQQGDLIAYSGSADQLHEQFKDSGNNVQLAEKANSSPTTVFDPRMALIPLPPVELR